MNVVDSSVVLATARLHDATLWTQDSDSWRALPPAEILTRRGWLSPRTPVTTREGR